jgi:hypothetical protein
MLWTYDTTSEGQLGIDAIALILLPPMAAFCLAGFLARGQLIVWVITLAMAICLSVLTVFAHLGIQPFGITAGEVMLLQWGAGAVAILLAIAARWGLFSCIGFLAGAILGFFVFGYKHGGGGGGGDWYLVSFAGLDVMPVGGYLETVL